MWRNIYLLTEVVTRYEAGSNSGGSTRHQHTSAPQSRKSRAEGAGASGPGAASGSLSAVPQLPELSVLTATWLPMSVMDHHVQTCGRLGAAVSAASILKSA